MKPNPKNPGRGFTLVEMLIVVVIIIILAVLGFTGAGRLIENARKTQALSQFRDFNVGMTMIQTDYNRIPLPETKRQDGWDTIYGDPGGTYANDFFVSVLAGEDKSFPYDGGFQTKDVNPRLEVYMSFPMAPDNRGGVGKDGRLYDPWGHQVMIAVNGHQARNKTIVEFNSGSNDRRLHTWGLAEYTETKPGNEDFVFWSYGKDGKKGKNNPNNQAVVSLKNSDDMISW